MVIGVPVVGLEQVVVDVLGCQFHLHPVNPHGHELQHRHGAGGVLKERVVDPYGDLPAGNQLPLIQVDDTWEIAVGAEPLYLIERVE